MSEKITMQTPINDNNIPEILLKDKFSFKNIIDKIAMNITLVLINTADVEAVV